MIKQFCKVTWLFFYPHKIWQNCEYHTSCESEEIWTIYRKTGYFPKRESVNRRNVSLSFWMVLKDKKTLSAFTHHVIQFDWLSSIKHKRRIFVLNIFKFIYNTIPKNVHADFFHKMKVNGDQGLPNPKRTINAPLK